MILEYEATSKREFGPCPDCGQKIRRVWGYVYLRSSGYRRIFRRVDTSHQERDAVFDLITCSSLNLRRVSRAGMTVANQKSQSSHSASI
jgi:hypothetical protein